ncbi:winged helix-turn-helix domain-containing protein [Pseudoalteromonas sp. T1lg24]|uniref:winged helix-turn-helix domain-containing protein n=1 Tax=Pseudoalteromonas sp. T1lg24 TaxID=2077099 RepID=UPI000CF74723|nr:winged helix-turn-helix domain-containing protein [Pseudoalteromonas sp. T1lg24]
MNKQQFWLSDYFIDLSRNQITYKNNTTNLQPKVMAVLHVLARQQGQVVSFESLMAEVWPNTVVTSNTLQRCISQLRKVFNDSQQEVIRTHAKSGYSLEIPIVKRKIPRVFLATRYLVAMLCVFTTVLLINFLSHSNDENHHAFSKVSAVTNTDDNESDASYSPSGRYIAYLKNINACESEIWLKDTTTFESHQLTKKAGVYGQPNWSPNGKHLVFSQRNLCPTNNKPVRQEFCWSVAQITLDTLPNSPFEAAPLLDCAPNFIRQVNWISDETAVLLQERAGVMGLYTLSRDDQQPKLLYSNADKEIYSFTYNDASQQYSLLAINRQEQHYLIHLNREGNQLSEYPLQLPADVESYTAFQIKLHPTEAYFITSTNQGIFKISQKGVFSPLFTSSRFTLQSPSYHPNGKSVIATEINADTDIAYIPFDKMTHDKPINELSFTLARSNASDDMARFQPSGDLILWSSKREGVRRIWLSHHQNQNSKAQLLPKQTDSMYGKSAVWSPNGKHVASLTNNKIELVALNGQKQVINIPFLVSGILQWTSDNNLLLKGRNDGLEALYVYDIASEQYQTLSTQPVYWAHMINKTSYVYLNDELVFYYVKNGVAQTLDLPKGQFERPYFALFDNKIYGINAQHELWSYSLTTHKKQTLAQLSDSARYVSDVNEQGVLLTVMKKFSKELVQLH